MRHLLVFISLFPLVSCTQSIAFEIPRASSEPVVDGVPSDATWELADWRAMDQLMLGQMPTAEDFSGRYKLLWTPEHLYLLAEITDDILIDAHADPLNYYWEDDMLEILIDEDASGGIHTEDFNAFAYHMALDNQIVDIAPKDGVAAPRLFPNHATSSWRRDTESDHKIYWEARIAVHNDTHVYGDDESSRVILEAGKNIGLMVAYCDADDANGRQHFLGDVEIEPVNGDRNRGYIDASVFGKATLVDQ